METRDAEPPVAQESSSRSLTAGTKIDGRYEIVRKLGSGGVGEVFLAEHIRLHRAVAIKVLQPGYAASQKLRLRFEREAHALAMMSHPNIVSVSDYGLHDDAPFLVMERLRGESLSARLKRGALDPSVAFEVFRQILQALAFAHDGGWVHRDLKPGNIFLRELVGGTTHVKILDFGLAKMVTADGRRAGPKLTMTGMVFGTPAYMAPEQAVGAETDARTDLYSAAVVLFEMLAGRRLFQGEAEKLMRQHLQVPPPLLHEVAPQRRACAELDELFQVALAKERGDRFQTAEEFLAALDGLPAPPVTVVEPVVQPPVDVSGKTVLPDDLDETTPADGAAEAKEAGAGASRGAAAGALGAPRGGASPEGTGRARLLAATVAGALLGAAIASPLTCMLSSSGPEPMARNPRQAAPVEGREPDAVHVRRSEREAAVEPTPALAPAAPDALWGVEGVPPLLQEGRNYVDTRQELPPAMLSRLRRFARSHPDDPRPLLILARHHIQRGALTDGIDRYERAYAASPSARQDEAMLHDLVDLVKNRTVSRRAARAVERIYGVDAIPRLAEVLEDGSLDDGERRRLESLRRRLVGF